VGLVGQSQGVDNLGDGSIAGALELVNKFLSSRGLWIRLGDELSNGLV
jgi:hypothetical protein